MAKINQYPLERLTFGDEDYYDIDYWDGATYQTAKIKGSVIKAGIQAGITAPNIYTNNGTLTADRTMDGANFELFFQEIGKFIVHSHKNNTDNVIFEVRSQTGYESFTIRDHNTGNHLFCVENGKVEISDAYYLPDVDGTSGQVMKTDGLGNVSWQDESASSGGVLGISDASGNYTYYSDFQTALLSASSGDTIEMFADIEETTNTTITLIDEITINGNGHTYTLNVDDTADAFTLGLANATAYFNNIKVIRTGRALGTASGAIGNFVNNTIKCQGAVFISDYGRGFRGDQGNIHNAHIISVEHGVYAPFSSKNLYNCHIEVSSTSARGTYLSGGEVNNCYVKAVSMAISVSAGQVYNSTGISTNSYGIFAVNIYDSIGKSTSSIGIGGQIASNCVGISSTDFGTNVGSSRNCTFISVSGSGAYRGSHQNATIISSSNYGINEPVQLDNCYVESSSNRVCSLRDNSEIRNSNLYCKWNSTTGECITSLVARTNPILTNTTIKVTNSGAYGINMYIGSTLRYANNSFQGTTIPINTTTTTQGIVNTSDSQGNILL